MTDPSCTDHRRLPIASLRRDGGTQVRAAMKADTVADYAAALTDGATFPPVVVFLDGADHWLADGFHRVAAHEAAGLSDVLAEVRQGTRRDALWYALSANRCHGLPMSSDDKRKAIGLMLSDPEWSTASDRAIAKGLGVDHKTVAKVRASLSTGENPQSSAERTGADGRTINTANIGKGKRDKPAADIGRATEAERAALRSAVEQECIRRGLAFDGEAPAADATSRAAEAPEPARTWPADPRQEAAYSVAMPSSPVDLSARWSPRAVWHLQAYLEHERDMVAACVGVKASEATETDALWYAIKDACICRGLTPDDDDGPRPPARREVTPAAQAPAAQDERAEADDDVRGTAKRKSARALLARIRAGKRTLSAREAIEAAQSILNEVESKAPEYRIAQAMTRAYMAAVAPSAPPATPTGDPSELAAL